MASRKRPQVGPLSGPRVTGARDYVLHLLLLLCGPEACATLLPPPESWTPLEAPLRQRSTQDEMGGAPAATAAAAATATAAPGGSVRRSGLRPSQSGSAMTGQSGRQVSGRSFQAAPLQNPLYFKTEDEQSCRRNVYMWECDRENIVPLTEEALCRHTRAGDGGTAPHLWTRL